MPNGPKAIVKQDSHGWWFFLLMSSAGSLIYEGKHHCPPGAKGKAMEDRARLLEAASKAHYVTEDPTY